MKDTFIALDLELNNAEDNSTPNPKIIQVGIAWGTLEDFRGNDLDCATWYFDPQEPIYPFITGLTGITDSIINFNKVSHQECAGDIMQIIKNIQDKSLPNSKVYPNFVTWGGGDWQELKAEFDKFGVNFPFGGRRIVDTKTIHTFHMLTQGKKPSGGLSSALAQYHLKFEGDQHRADDDAYNTLRLFFTLAQRYVTINNMITGIKGAL